MAMTGDNLREVFVGESQANRKYSAALSFRYAPPAEPYRKALDNLENMEECGLLRMSICGAKSSAFFKNE